MNRLSINSWFLSCLVFHCLLVLEEWHILHDRPWITPWIKSISNELDVIFHVRTSQRHVNCDVITNVAKSFVVTNCVVYALTLELFWCSFPSLLRDSANIHQNNPPWAHKQFATPTNTLLSGVPDYFDRNKISSGGDLSHYSSASLY